MKIAMVGLIILAVIGLGIAGIAFLVEANWNFAHAGQRHEVLTPALIAGITCLLIATALLILGVVLTMFPKRDSVKERDTSFTARDRD